jgi:hypothetical protein
MLELKPERIKRRDVSGHRNHFAKTLVPPTVSPDTPNRLNPTNPVPAFMESIGLSDVTIPNTVRPDLMHGTDITFWDGVKRKFFLLRDKDLRSPFNNETYPGSIIRVPRGVIFHASVHGHGPPPHTIHWHGIEPTPMNDGVGHCSFEVGEYTYQWQPNYIGTYFYHCHRNTTQHFEYGLYGGLIIEPPDAYDQGPGRNPGGYPRRTAANLSTFPHIPGFKGGSLESGDPHAMTVQYDKEVFWVFDDIDSVWMNEMEDPRAGIAVLGSVPGENDIFRKADFHDYNPDYFFVTGVGFPAPKYSTGTIASQIVVAPAFNSGVSGMQVSVEAEVDQNILVRIICAAYSKIQVKFPVDAIIIAFDGRALGVPPHGSYNYPYLLPKGESIEITTARRFDVLIKSSVRVDDFAEVSYFSHERPEFLFKGRIPFSIR